MKLKKKSFFNFFSAGVLVSDLWIQDVGTYFPNH